VKDCTDLAPPESPLYRDLQRVLKTLGANRMRISFSGGTLASMHLVLKGSDALTILPASVVFQTRQIVATDILPLRIDHPDRQLGLLSRRDEQPSPALAHFAEFATDRLRDLQERMDAQDAGASRGGSLHRDIGCRVQRGDAHRRGQARAFADQMAYPFSQGGEAFSRACGAGHDMQFHVDRRLPFGPVVRIRAS
jgi:hypothetical protein